MSIVNAQYLEKSVAGAKRGRNMGSESKRALMMKKQQSREELTIASPLKCPPTKSAEELVSRISMDYFPRRFMVVGLCFCSLFICYMSRVALSVAIIPMSQEFGWDKAYQGTMLSCFYYGYILTQIPGGYFSDLYGGKLVLSIGVMGMAVCTLVTPTFASLHMFALVGCRILVGAGQGLVYPTIHALLAHWVPQEEKNRSVAFVSSGSYIGSGLCMLLSPMLIVHCGWPSVFYIYALLGIFWFTLWHLVGADRPGSHQDIMSEEIKFIKGVLSLTKGDEAIKPSHITPTSAGRREVPWALIAQHPSVWACLCAHFCFNFGFYVLLSWMPSYYHSALRVPLSQVGYYAVVPYMVMFGSSNVAGMMADRLIKKGVKVLRVRKNMVLTGFLGPAFFLLLLCGGNPSSFQAMLYLSFAMGLGSFALSGHAINHLDFAPEYAGVFQGLAGIAGTSAAILGVTVSGRILSSTGSWDFIFTMVASLFVLGATVFNLFATADRLFPNGVPSSAAPNMDPCGMDAVMSAQLIRELKAIQPVEV